MSRLFILTMSDEIERHMSEYWGRPLLDGGAHDLHVVENPSREDVEARLPGNTALIYFGHGFPDALGQPALVDLVNIGRMGGTVVAVACRSARVLGEAARAAGVETYVGFSDDIPVITAPVIDALMRDGFVRLVHGEESAPAFEQRFIAACEEIQSQHFSFHRNDRAFVIGQSAQVLKMGLRVLQP
jgi:hypothetical protein